MNHIINIVHKNEKRLIRSQIEKYKKKVDVEDRVKSMTKIKEEA